ncbi:acyl-CoA thioesterase [Acinetobacter silvestris]|uniref:Acyl-CoA thioesterase II n=1 Tax=Acinetobacter silvestris TaxID=1977882 RepID=A0A1Y3CJY8_9GAMM|nr:acyl-CoA thioesterase II [Acinetobacter silvestris]OTG67429.1 acyl-CoA thioesterase II [Acinetobacter silvestris]
MRSITQKLVDLLNVQQLDDYLFQGQNTRLFGSHLMGGQLVGQALIAASKTTDRPAHSLHAYFIRSGRTDLPILFQVENLRDGKSFATRQVHALQDGQIIFSAMVSFAYLEEGLNYQVEQPHYPSPDELESEQQLKQMIFDDAPESMHSIFMRQFHVKIHPVQPFNPFKPIPSETNYAEYFQTFETIPDELNSSMMHQAIAAYYSDYNLLTASLRPHGVSYATGDVRSASLDHTIYFHHEFKVDEWLLYDMNATISSQSRGLNFGRMWQDGKLVCSVIQESLMRDLRSLP